jgi:C-terminal processing protease CtpA/Prc
MGLPPSFYDGKVMILANEQTQSHAEFTIMSFQTVPGAKTFGSQTAGADGNISTIYLPCGVTTIFTGLGVFYPDGTPTQRVGIKIDYQVKPTMKGIREGRDEVLERAIRYINTGS